MTREDTGSRTEADAAKHAQLNAWPDMRDERDEGGPVADHTCTSPNPRRCAICALDVIIADQQRRREDAKVLAEHVAEQNSEWWNEA